MCTAHLVPLPSGILFGFKAFPAEFTRLDELTHSSAADSSCWSAIYPQLSLSQAIAYLPNQFDRGHNVVHIVLLRTKVPVNLVVINDHRMKDPLMSSVLKATLIRQSLVTAGLLDPSQSPDGLLLDEVGRDNLFLCIPDADELELVVPHCLFSGDVFCDPPDIIFTFEQNPARPGFVDKVQQLPELSREILYNHALLVKELESHCRTHKIDTHCDQLIHLITPISIL
mmetsp:Transcript_23924/g.39328  ORF Transcript_23924/g.39328 Transcript_23924/m.39328 type:complete len:227 (+) Transcript_23924:723-1403(+)